MNPDENIVAVLDILGYTRLLEEMTLDDLQSLIQHGILGALYTAKLMSGKIIIMDELGGLVEYEKVLSVEYAVVSDTIILYPKRGTNSPLINLCATVSLLMSELLTHGVLLRGAVDVDTFRRIEGEAIFIGRALVGAHKLELAQDWSGCSLTARVARRFAKQIKEMRTNGLVVEYQVPMKSGIDRTHRPRWALNWFYYNVNNPPAKVARLQEAYDRAPELAKGKVMAAIKFEQFLRTAGLSFTAPMRKELFDRSQIRGGYRFEPRESRTPTKV